MYNISLKSLIQLYVPIILRKEQLENSFVVHTAQHILVNIFWKPNK